MVDRVIVTPEAAAVIERLKAVHGPLMFHQSGGCCDGCVADVLSRRASSRSAASTSASARSASCPFWMWSDQYVYFANSQLIIDVVPGRGGGFSLESPEGVRFLTRSRLFSDDEVTALEQAGPPARGGESG